MRTRSMGSTEDGIPKTGKARLFSTQYLSVTALEGLSTYQYKSGGLTWLDHLHNPAWNAAVALLPMWLAPNLITLAGTVLVVAGYLLSVFYLPEFQGDDLPRWLYWFFAMAVFLYVNLDCMDGKQARRTGSSSPLGQLFDHGCDALALHLLLDTVRTSLMLPIGWPAVTMEMAIMVPWMLAHWEEYHTGMMLYGNGWFGVLEGNYALMLIHLVTAIAGPKIWQVTVVPQGVLPSYLEGLGSLRYAMLAAVAFMAMWSALGQLYRVLVFPTASLTRKEAGNKHLGHGSSVLHLMYILLLVGLGWAYLTATPLFARRDSAGHIQLLWSPWGASAGPSGVPKQLEAFGRLVGHARIVGLTWGLVYAEFASQLIMAHMCKEQFYPAIWALSVLALGCVNTLFGLTPSLLVDTVLLVLTFLGYCHFVACVITQICRHLGIHCLTIKPKVIKRSQ